MMKCISINEYVDATENNYKISSTNPYNGMKDTEVNIEDYFNEVYRDCVDMDEINASNADLLFHSQSYKSIMKHISINENVDATENNYEISTTNNTMEYTEVNIEDYFDKVYCSCVDVNEVNASNTDSLFYPQSYKSMMKRVSINENVDATKNNYEISTTNNGMEYTEVNIEDYFDEVYRGCIDVNEVNASNANSFFHF
ncbi:hypothetical protein C2G38_2175437 [Gigaspora rosea]|uniref:Uncharacterized protein n=1 Tax=Gigaspora rosea TaxID=44941 RepID=A0A397VRW6_9GLOM|nr:hypothetical protein C2G38_2175437 [Gigaspora rosea]